MGLIGYSAISVGISAGVWGNTGSLAAGGATIGVGVLIDVDDYRIDFYRWYVRRKRNGIHLFSTRKSIS